MNQDRFSIGDRIDFEGDIGVVVRVDRIDGTIAVRWVDDPDDTSSLLDADKVRLVERAKMSRPVRYRVLDGETVEQDQDLAATVEIRWTLPRGTAEVLGIQLGRHAADAAAIARQFGCAWNERTDSGRMSESRAAELRDAFLAEG